jgi:hypothetical protein
MLLQIKRRQGFVVSYYRNNKINAFSEWEKITICKCALRRCLMLIEAREKEKGQKHC